MELKHIWISLVDKDLQNPSGPSFIQAIYEVDST